MKKEERKYYQYEPLTIHSSVHYTNSLVLRVTKMPCSYKEAREQVEHLRPLVEAGSLRFKNKLPAYIQGQTRAVYRAVCRLAENQELRKRLRSST